MTEGTTDPRPVALEYLNEAWTIREDTDYPANHVAESIAHILLTHIGEHDTLPWFGGRMREILFEPNSPETWPVLKHFFLEAAIRWEKRARFPEPDGVTFQPTGTAIDAGRLPTIGWIQFIIQQILGNLVAPFVNPRQARAQEYPLAAVDASGHDYQSRYFEAAQSEYQGIRYNRLSRQSKALKPAYDDQFYTVMHGDTWLLIAWKLYGEIRFWPYIAEIWTRDAAEDGLTRHNADPSQEPPVGTMLRAPSEARMRIAVGTI